MAAHPVRGAGDPQMRVAGTQVATFFEEHGSMVYGLCRTLIRERDDDAQATLNSGYMSLRGESNMRD